MENQPVWGGAKDLWRDDLILQRSVAVAGAQAAVLSDFGNTLGHEEMREAGLAANRNLPEMVAFDRGGRQLDEVQYHPAYHQLMGVGLRAGYASVAWQSDAGGHATHAAMVYLMSQVEPGVCCPMTMTYAAVPVLDRIEGMGEWRGKLLARDYDPSVRPISAKSAVTIGMAMTEKQGGSDLRANTTRAVADGDVYRLTGHKWFCSAPMSDGFLTLAQAPGGLTCFLVPRWLEDRRNGIRIMRLKDKLGNRANASAEIEYNQALAFRIGTEGSGIRSIMEMVHHTRLDTALAPAGLMRAAIGRAYHWARHRRVFQKTLIDQPLMRAVLSDLTLDLEAALALGFRVARAFDGGNESDRSFARIAVALAKFSSNKRCPVVTYEAMECLGGMGYVEETGMPLLYREAPLNSIWEGSGNVICLDILRTLARDEVAADVLRDELQAAVGADRRYDEVLKAHFERWPGLPEEAEARWFAENMATLLAASQLIRHAPVAVADGYVATRVAGQRGHVTGSVSGLDFEAILAQVAPAA